MTSGTSTNKKRRLRRRHQKWYLPSSPQSSATYTKCQAKTIALISFIYIQLRTPILCILAAFIPPLAVVIVRGLGVHLAINFVLLFFGW
jgi:uncharacterized membrane protein YqaE (UPF0057 family)